MIVCYRLKGEPERFFEANLTATKNRKGRVHLVPDMHPFEEFRLWTASPEIRQIKKGVMEVGRKRCTINGRCVRGVRVTIKEGGISPRHGLVEEKEKVAA